MKIFSVNPVVSVKLLHLQNESFHIEEMFIKTEDMWTEKILRSIQNHYLYLIDISCSAGVLQLDE